MITNLRLLTKQFRFELVASTIAVVSVFVVTLLIHAHIASIVPTKACLDAWMTTGPNVTSTCPDLTEYFSRVEHEAGQLTGAFVLLPPLLGAILGSILVAREIEQRTAQFAWSLGSNRLRWLAERVLPVAVYLLVLLVLLAVAAEILEASRNPYIDTRAAFVDYGQRGLPLIARGMAGFALAVLIGSIVGRQLPALILSVLVPVGLLYGSAALFPFGVQAERIIQDGNGFGYSTTYLTDYQVRQFFIDPNGKETSDPPVDGKSLGDVKVGWYAIPGRRLGEVEAREGAVLLGVAVVGFAATAVVVRRRRPY